MLFSMFSSGAIEGIKRREGGGTLMVLKVGGLL